MRRLLGICCLVASCAASKPTTGELERHRFEHAAMGTAWSIVLYAPDEVTAERAARAAFDVVDRIDRVASDYDRASELARLEGRADADQVEVSELLADLLAEARALAAATDGAFDPTLGAATKLWRRARRQEELPSDALLEAAHRSIGWEQLSVDRESGCVRLGREGMRLDLGGVAKGQALDRALEAARGAGASSVLLEGGGDLRAGAPPPGAAHWVVAIEGGERRVALRDAGMATSGDRYRGFVLDGTRYSHILDPRTARPSTEERFATVIARTAAEADAYASACCVVGREGAMRWFDEASGRAALIGGRGARTGPIGTSWSRYEIPGTVEAEP